LTTTIKKTLTVVPLYR